ncbi:MAG: permease [Bacteroidota bacterium]
MQTKLIAEQAVALLSLSGRYVIQLFPYVILGAGLGELLRFTSWTKLVYRVCTKYRNLSILFSVILGTVSPLCTYGTVPFIIQLYRAGIPLAPLMAFLSASSLMNPQLFIITWGGISPEMAMARTVSVVLYAFIAGIVMNFVPAASVLNCSLHDASDTADSEAGEILSRVPKRFSFSSYAEGVWKNIQFISYYMITGILAGAFIEVFVPGRLILQLFRPGEWYSVILASLLGVPLYACGGGTIPLIRSLLFGGMSSGAALAFFIAGPATRLTPLSALATFLRPRMVALYVLSVIVYSVLAGIIYH